MLDSMKERVATDSRRLASGSGERDEEELQIDMQEEVSRYSLIFLAKRIKDLN